MAAQLTVLASDRAATEKGTDRYSPARDLAQAGEIADRKGIGYQTLLKIWCRKV